jgi:hypothetical protein
VRTAAAGWDQKPGVRIVFGRWQDVLLQLGTYDGIFFDTCAVISGCSNACGAVQCTLHISCCHTAASCWLNHLCWLALTSCCG